MLDNPRILLVAKKSEDRDTLTRILQTNYQVCIAENGRQVLELIYKTTIDAVILDLSFEGGHPIEILKTIKHHDPYIEAVIISGKVDAEKTMMAFKHGVSDYIPKPFHMAKTISVINSTLEKRELNLHLKSLLGELAEVKDEIPDEASSFQDKEKQPLIRLAGLIGHHFTKEQHPNTEGHKDYLEFAKILSSTLETKDAYTYGHSERVSYYSTLIAESLTMQPEDKEDIQIAAYLHDIGKLGISNNTMQKKTRLNPQEWEAIKEHPEKGVDLLKPFQHAEKIKSYIRHHHERFAGGGYPCGLAGETIPLGGRIIAIADSYDAITSNRPYRKNIMTHIEAQEELTRCAGTQFDPSLVNVFIKSLNNNDQFCCVA